MKLVIKPERIRKTEDRDITLTKFMKWLVPENKELNTKFGLLTKEDLKQNKIEKFKETFYVVTASFLDEYKNLKRDRQIITLKDVGAIITSTGINKDSVVLDAGTGSGALACYLAKICKKVVSLDIEKENTSLGKENAKTLGIKNIDFITADIATYKKGEYDIFVLDIPKPESGIETANLLLKRGGFFLVYSPQIEQVMKVVRTAPEQLLVEEIKEVTERKWAVDNKRSRPVSGDVGHTAFLTVFRKL